MYCTDINHFCYKLCIWIPPCPEWFHTYVTLRVRANSICFAGITFTQSDIPYLLLNFIQVQKLTEHNYQSLYAISSNINVQLKEYIYIHTFKPPKSLFTCSFINIIYKITNKTSEKLKFQHYKQVKSATTQRINHTAPV